MLPDERMADQVKSDATAAVALLLDAEELAYFELNVVRGKTRSKCAAELGWPMVKVDRVRRRLNLHLAKLRAENVNPGLQIEAAKVAENLEPMGTKQLDDRVHDDDGGGADLLKREGRFRATTPCRIYLFSRGNSLNPFYLEHLSHGLSTWSLCPSNERYLLNYRIIEAPAIILPKGILMNTDLNQQLKAETAKRDRIAEKVHTLHIAYDEASRDLRIARGELEGEMAAAALEERPSRTENLEKKITKLQISVDAKRAELTGAESALQQQGVKVVAVEADIIAKRNETFLAESRPRREEMRQLVERLGVLAHEHHNHIVESGAYQEWELVMGSIFPKVDETNHFINSYRNAAFRVIHAAAAMKNEDWQKNSIRSEVA